MKKALSLSLALILIIGLSVGAQEGVGAFAGFQFGVDARVLGMGGAFVAIADNYSAANYNPAGIARAGGPRVGMMTTNKFGLDISFNFASAIVPIAGLTVSGAYIGQNVPGIELVNPQGEVIGTITSSEMILMGSVAMDIVGIGYAGGSIKSYSHDLHDESGSGFGFDVGLLIIDIIPGFSVGASAFDIGGTRITWTTGAVDLVSARFKVGAAYAMNALTVAVDYDFNEVSVLRLGAEFDLEVVAVRGGAVMPEGEDFSFTVGAGLRLGALTVDFAWMQLPPGLREAENVSDTIVLSAEFVF
jgi:hypothetical protein